MQIVEQLTRTIITNFLIISQMSDIDYVFGGCDLFPFLQVEWIISDKWAAAGNDLDEKQQQAIKSYHLIYYYRVADKNKLAVLIVFFKNAHIFWISKFGSQVSRDL